MHHIGGDTLVLQGASLFEVEAVRLSGDRLEEGRATTAGGAEGQFPRREDHVHADQNERESAPSRPTEDDEHLATFEEAFKVPQDGDLGELLADAHETSERAEEAKGRVADGFLV